MERLSQVAPDALKKHFQVSGRKLGIQTMALVAKNCLHKKYTLTVCLLLTSSIEFTYIIVTATCTTVEFTKYCCCRVEFC